MTVDDAIKALSSDILKLVNDNYVLGLGSGRAATALVRSLSSYL
ncbi:MAG: ribose-5-phosphate isomerase, partial [Thermoproteota archaeon]